MSEPINVLPALALRGTTILPGMIIHFDVSRERSKKAIEAAMFQDQKIFLVTQKDPQIEDPGFVQLFQVGTIAYIKQVVKLPDNLLRVLVEGKRRAEPEIAVLPFYVLTFHRRNIKLFHIMEQGFEL